MKPLLFLFILDFSGSMYQPVDGQIKYEVVQENVDQIVAAVDKENRDKESGVMVFGLGSQKSCNDIQYKKMPTRLTDKEIRSYKPGSFSKTPLADSIKRGADIALQRGVERLVLFTDGADSCDGDPCKELERANARFKKANIVLDMSFIGIDLRSDAPKFECFKKDYSNININNSKVDNAEDIQEALEQASAMQKEINERAKGTIFVRGAPTSSKFKAVLNQRSMSRRELAKAKGTLWQEQERVRLEADNYQVITNHRGSQAVPIQLEPREREVIYWSDFFKNKKVPLIYKKNGISIMLTPEFSTKISHRTVPVNHFIESPFGRSENLKLPLEFGAWKLEIMSPPWLKKSAGKVNIDLPVNKKFYKLDIFKLFNLRLERVPDPSKAWVLGLSSDEKFYVQKGFKMVPVLKDSQVEWLNSKENVLSPPTQ